MSLDTSIPGGPFRQSSKNGAHAPEPSLLEHPLGRTEIKALKVPGNYAGYSGW